MDQQFYRGSHSSNLCVDVVHCLEDLCQRWLKWLGSLGDRADQFSRIALEETARADCDRRGRLDRSILPLMNQSKFVIWLKLLWMFLKVNLLSPSGPASIGLLYKEAVDKKVMTEAQFVEAVGFSNV